MLEVWKRIEDYPDYEVSNLGRIRRSAPNQRGQFAGRVMKPVDNGNGYHGVCLHQGGFKKRHYVHRLVCAGFNGPAPSEKHEVAHKDGSRSNNQASNLRWATRSQNHDDKRRHGTAQQGVAHGNSKLTDADVHQIRSTPTIHGSGRALARQYGVSPALISAIRTGRLWTHI